MQSSENPVIRLGISACLLGEKVRYDGNHKLDHYLHDVLGPYVEWTPVCPEVECGLPIPREAMRLVGTKESQRLLTVHSHIDHTERMMNWTAQKLESLSTIDLCGFVFKTRSPSSALRDAKIYTESGVPLCRGPGLFAGEFIRRFPDIPVEDEGRLHDEGIRENFIERVFTFARWRERMQSTRAAKDLIAWHSDHKLLLMAHSPKHLRHLGKIVAEFHSRGAAGAFQRYFEVMMEAMALPATVKKQTNTLQHVAGYFKKVLTPIQRRELAEIIEAFHRELVPLIVPITLLNHYVRTFEEEYLARQVYLHPHPLELKLRNHA